MVVTVVLSSSTLREPNNHGLQISEETAYTEHVQTLLGITPHTIQWDNYLHSIYIGSIYVVLSIVSNQEMI